MLPVVRRGANVTSAKKTKKIHVSSYFMTVCFSQLCSKDMLNELQRSNVLLGCIVVGSEDAHVTTDCGAVGNLKGPPVNAPDDAHAAAMALMNGTDLELLGSLHIHPCHPLPCEAKGCRSGCESGCKRMQKERVYDDCRPSISRLLCAHVRKISDD